MATAIITGAAGNLGKAMVKGFLEKGYTVLGILAPADKAEELPLEEAFSLYRAELTNEKETGETIEKLISDHGSIDVAVLTVGGFAMGTIADTSLEQIQEQIKLNFNTAYAVARPVYRQMRSQGKGRIFLVGSGPGMDMHNSKGMTAYGLSKSLLFRLAELLNEESDGLDIITQVIVPSTIDTPQNRKAMPDADYSKWVKAETIAGQTIQSIKIISENKLVIF